jgi:hypothetical protein
MKKLKRALGIPVPRSHCWGQSLTLACLHLRLVIDKGPGLSRTTATPGTGTSAVGSYKSLSGTIQFFAVAIQRAFGTIRSLLPANNAFHPTVVPYRFCEPAVWGSSSRSTALHSAKPRPNAGR